MKLNCSRCQTEVTLPIDIPEWLRDVFLCTGCFEAQRQAREDNERLNTLIRRPRLPVTKKIDEAIKENELYRILRVNRVKVEIAKIKKVLVITYDSFFTSNVAREFMSRITGDKPNPQGEVINEYYRQAIGRLQKALDNEDILNANKKIIEQDIAALEGRIGKEWTGDAVYQVPIPKRMTTEQLYQCQAILIYAYVKNQCANLSITDAQIRKLISDILTTQYRDEKFDTQKIKSYLDNKNSLSQDIKKHLKHLSRQLSIPSLF